ncbi:energy transducer TonB [Spirosoma rhododendri]|uniref:Energy transducer TonB n=1 Tax=Spirosoma rhododendri TaxID=2728024 RepID=A0A7L5DPB5_9BACT|nr:energy transducer TonB [Spirosoma rhododendri]QJD80246.1 energy transducer TonB [Spirosoma rhododendri]
MARFQFVSLLFCLLLCISQFVSAQQVTAQDLLLRELKQTGEIYTVVEKQPTFSGGQNALQQYLRQHRRYPEAARKAGISGRVFVAFVVNTDGSIQDVELLKGIGLGCDEEAIRLVKGMPKWIPGSQSGKAIRVKYNLPIAFGLTE